MIGLYLLRASSNALKVVLCCRSILLRIVPTRESLPAVLLPLKFYFLQPLLQYTTTDVTTFTLDPAISPRKGSVLSPEYFRISMNQKPAVH